MNNTNDTIKSLTVSSEDETPEIKLEDLIDINSLLLSTFNQADANVISSNSFINIGQSSASPGIANTQGIIPTVAPSPNTSVGTGTLGTTINIAPNTLGTAVGAWNQTTGTWNTAQSSFAFEDEVEKKIIKIVKKELGPVLSRLAILETPSPEVMEKFESLKMAYEHYKLLEGLMFSEIEKAKTK